MLLLKGVQKSISLKKLHIAFHPRMSHGFLRTKNFASSGEAPFSKVSTATEKLTPLPNPLMSDVI